MTESSSSTTGRLSEISTELAELVSQCAPGVVAVRLRAGRSRSGILWRPGYVVTAAEALEDETASLLVGSSTAIERPARLLGRDPSTDVAVLAVEGLTGEALPPGDPATLRAGQFALTLGRSLEHGPIVAFGSVAVAGAPWDSQLGGRIVRFIRLGVSLTQAAEGGAVLDLDGRLIGMAVLGPRRTVLAIPAPTIGRVVDHLLAKGSIGRGYLGVAMQPVQLPPALQKLAGTGTGLLVSSVDAHSGAALGGVVLGDVIVAWNGEPVRDYRQVQRLLGPESIGTTLAVAAVRAGALIDLKVAVGERPASG
jgi:S1-C subfamily serine protease